MGGNYGHGREYIGDCNECGIEHYGHSDEEHDDEPLCPRCEAYAERAALEAEWKRAAAAAAAVKQEKRAAKAAGRVSRRCSCSALWPAAACRQSKWHCRAGQDSAAT